jgi:hypothetical protein
VLSAPGTEVKVISTNQVGRRGGHAQQLRFAKFLFRYHLAADPGTTPRPCTSPYLQRELNGRNYYEIEFTAANPRYTRHQLAVVAVNNGGCTHGLARRGKGRGVLLLLGATCTLLGQGQGVCMQPTLLHQFRMGARRHLLHLDHRGQRAAVGEDEGEADDHCALVPAAQLRYDRQ